MARSSSGNFSSSHGGGVIFTVSKYLLPDGTDLNGKGLEPDILVSEEEEQIKKRRKSYEINR